MCAFPSEGWPPRLNSGFRSLRVLIEGTATADYADNAYLFVDVVGANPFEPTPFVEAGQEGEPTVITPLSPGSPLGAGRDPRDTSFNPNVFKRGSGTGTDQTTFVEAGGVVTYTDFTTTFNQRAVGKKIRITGATSAGNNGTFVVTAATRNTLTWVNASGVTEDFPEAGSFRLRLVEEGPPKPAIRPGTIRVMNLGETNSLYISFDGENDQGFVPAGDTHVYRNRFESGIAVRSAAGTDFAIEAW